MSFEQTPIYIYKSGVGGDGAFLDLVSLLDAYETLRFRKGWNTPGTFEITLNEKTLHASDLTIGRFIRIGTDNTKNGRIKTVKKELSKDGVYTLVVSGVETWGLLDHRSIIPAAGSAYFTSASTVPVETGIKNAIINNAGSGALSARQFASMNLVASSGRGSNYEMSERYTNLLNAITAALIATNSGMTCTLNQTTKKWDLDFALGTDRTATVIFSKDFDSEESASYTQSDDAYRNFAIVAGQGEGINRTVRSVYVSTEPTDIDRREMFVDARDLTTTASLDARGAQKLLEVSFISFLDVTALAYSRYVYGTSYNVGDKVTLREFGVEQTAYITSAQEEWKNGQYNLTLGFDRDKPQLTGQVKGAALAQIRQNATIEKRQTDGAIIEYKTVISYDMTISTGSTGVSYSPVSIAPGVTVTIPPTSTWRIIP